MKSTGLVRHVDELGRVVLPKELRTVLHIKEGDSIEFFSGDQTLILRKFRTTSCIFCDNLDAIYFKERFVCGSCINEVVGGSEPAASGEHTSGNRNDSNLIAPETISPRGKQSSPT